MTNGTEAPVETAPLAPAPIVPQARPSPSQFSVEVIVETTEGFHAKVTAWELEPGKVLQWLKQTSQTLKNQGWKPVSLAPVINVAAPSGVAAANGAAPPSGEARWIQPTKIGELPACSLHGEGKKIEGVYKEGNKANQPVGAHYSFWGCKVQNCRPKGEPLPKGS